MAKFDPQGYLKFITNRYKETDPTAFETFMEVVSVARSMNCGMDSYFQRLGISHARFKVMINLLVKDNEGGVSPAGLAELLGVKRATVTGLLDTLENDQWIERHPDPNDRRGLLIRITQAGIEKLDSVLPSHYQRISKLFESFTAEEHKQLRVLIRKFGEGLETFEASANDTTEESKDSESGVEEE